MKKISASEQERLESISLFEKELKMKGFYKIAGIDEAGRGPLAGPVVAAACILPEGVLFSNLNDSKQLKKEERNRLFQEMIMCPDLFYGIGIVDVEMIDEINILQATFMAMQQAFQALAIPPDYLLIDGNRLPSFPIPAKSIVQGDGLSISIAAASIFAKVTRDQIMEEWDEKYPEYGFKQHKGYGTEAHMRAINMFGPCPIHRKSFHPIHTMIKK